MNSVTGMLSAKRHQAEAVLSSNGQRNCRGPNLIGLGDTCAAVIALLGIAPPPLRIQRAANTGLVHGVRVRRTAPRVQQSNNSPDR